MDDQNARLIEAFLSGELEGVALQNFLRRLKNEETLAAELALHKEVDMRLEAMQKEEKLDEWKQFLAENAVEEDTPAKRQPLYLYVGIAASILLLITVYWMFLRPTPPQQLADQYWKETALFAFNDINRSTERSPEHTQTLKMAYTKFEEQAYQETIDILIDLPDEDETVLLRAACFYHLAEYQRAQEHFQMIVDGTEFVSKDEAAWYLALTYLKQNERASAQKWLEQIQEQKSWNHKYARELLEKL